MARLNKKSLAFYDEVAERIRGLIDRSGSSLTIAWLARRIDWNRASLSNFLNRTTRTIPTHFLPKIALALNVSIGYLMEGDGLKQTGLS